MCPRYRPSGKVFTPGAFGTSKREFKREAEMLDSADPNLLNGDMETLPSSAPSAASLPAGGAATAPDWRPAPGIMDRMLAYRDWWNIPASRSVRNRRAPHVRARPQSDAARPDQAQ